jgi:S-adenosylmethionine synthetase
MKIPLLNLHHMNYLFTSESVSEGHPDKVADQISDALLDEFLAYDPQSKVACETLVTTGQVVLAGEVKSKAYVDVAEVARQVIAKVGYTRSEYRFEAESCGVFSSIHEQSDDINRGVDAEVQGAGDQGMMFGYATNETESYMPLPIDLSHALVQELANIRKNQPDLMPYLRPDAKSQVTVEYSEEGVPLRIDTIVISTQHDEFEQPRNDCEEAQLEADRKMQSRIRSDVKTILIPRVKAQYRGRKDIHKLFEGEITYHVNPTGKFVIGGPHGDTGLTGRKIIVDTYGGKAPHGGGAFSGKDPSKVDRSAAYAARYIAKNMVAAGVADEMLIQLSYAIGVEKPISVNVNTFGKNNVKLSDGEIAKKISTMFDLSPRAIERELKLRNPIYFETASYGHMGRTPQKVKKEFNSRYMKDPIRMEVELFTWEALNHVESIRKEFGL